MSAVGAYRIRPENIHVDKRVRSEIHLRKE